MGIRNYGNQVNIDTGTDVMEYIEKLNQSRISNQANARAERMALLQEAQLKYSQKITEQTKNQVNAINQWSSHGLDFDAATGSDINAAFSSKLPDLSEQWQGYVAASKSNDINPDFMTFNKQVMGQNASYMNTVIGRFNILAQEYKRENPNASSKSIMKYMQTHHDADQVYENYSRVAAMGGGQGAQFMTPLLYEPPVKDEHWLKDLASIVYDPGVEGEGARLKGGPVATLMGAAPLAYGAHKAYGTYTKGSAEYLKAAEAAWGDPRKGGMSAGKYEKVYGEKKGASGKAGTTWKASSKIKGFARNTGLSETALGKAAKWAKGKAMPKGAKPSVKGFVKGAAPYFAPSIGETIGDVAGDTGGDIGRTVGVATMAKALDAPKKTKSFWKFLARKVPAMLGKATTMAMADSPALPFGDLLALGFTASEIVGLYNEWTSED